MFAVFWPIIPTKLAEVWGIFFVRVSIFAWWPSISHRILVIFDTKPWWLVESQPSPLSWSKSSDDAIIQTVYLIPWWEIGSRRVSILERAAACINTSKALVTFLVSFTEQIQSLRCSTLTTNLTKLPNILQACSPSKCVPHSISESGFFPTKIVVKITSNSFKSLQQLPSSRGQGNGAIPATDRYQTPLFMCFTFSPIARWVFD